MDPALGARTADLALTHPPVRRAPWVLALLAAGFWLGRSSPTGLPGPEWLLMSAVALGTAAALVRGVGRRALLSIAVVVGAAGWFLARCDSWPADSIAHVLADEPRLIQVDAMVISAPRFEPASTGHFAEPGRGGSWRFDLRSRAVLADPDGEIPATGVLRAACRDRPFVRVGEIVLVRGFAALSRPATNPGEPDRRRLARQSGIAGRITIPQTSFISAPNRAPKAWERVSGTLYRWAWSARERSLSLLAPSDATAAEPTALIGALLLGHRDDELRDLSGAFTRVGLAHVLSVSGMNLTLLVGFVLLGVRLLGDRPHSEKLLALAIVAGYLVIVPAEAPIVRAALMIAVFIAAEFAGRRYDRINTLAWAAVLTLLWRPMDLWSPGFQLSYLGVASLIALARPLRTHLFGERPHTDDLGGGARGLLVRAVESTKDALAASLCAWGVCTPVVVYHTGVLAAAGPLASLIVWPLVAAITGLGYTALILSAAVPAVAGAASPLLHTMSAALAWIVRAIDLTPGTVWYLPRISPLLAVAATIWAAWCMSPGAPGRWPAKRRFNVGATIGFFWILTETLLLPRMREPDLRLDALDVPGGACAVVSAGGSAVLYNAGSSGGQAGVFLIPRALRELGIDRVPIAVISHAEPHCFNALPDLLRPLGIRTVLIGEQFARRASDSPGGPADLLLRHLRNAGIDVDTVASGTTFMVGTASASIVAPAAGELFDTHADASLMLHIQPRGTHPENPAALLMGEARDKGISALRDREPDLRATIILAPLSGKAARRPEDLARWLGATDIVSTAEPAAPTPPGSPFTLHHTRRGAVSVSK